PPIHGAGLTSKEVDAEIAARVAAAKPAISDQVVRLVVYDVSRATARDLNHVAIRSYKAAALNFNLDIRRPPPVGTVVQSAVGKRQGLRETVREFLERRPLDAELDRSEFVRLGVEYFERAGSDAPPL